MRVEHIESIDKKKVKVIMEDESYFPLYRGELRKYSVDEGQELKGEVYEFIISELVEKRGRERAMYILKNSDKTEKQLRDRLAGGSYPPAAVNKIIEFMKSYGYIDDCSYAENFVKIYSESQSIKMMRLKLVQRGVDREVADSVLEEFMENSQYSSEKLITEILRKKKFNCDSSDVKEKNRIISLLMRKGFKYDEIIETIRKSYRNI